MTISSSPVHKQATLPKLSSNQQAAIFPMAARKTGSYSADTDHTFTPDKVGAIWKILNETLLLEESKVSLVASIRSEYGWLRVNGVTACGKHVTLGIHATFDKMKARLLHWAAEQRETAKEKSNA